MKELSIEQKAKAYDEAKYIMKKYIESGNAGVIAENTIKKAFPELAEPEGERIRKELIEFVKSRGGFKQEYIAWLEKQSTPQVRTGLEWVNTIDDACDKRYSEEYAHGEYCHEQSFKWGFQEGVDWLEKQGEQKPVISDDALREGISHFGITQYQIDNWLKKYVDIEKQGEQKSDKVEPKFKQGDWIIFNGLVLRVGGVSGGFYVTTSKDGITNGYDWDIDNAARLWTIQDAKDGDVLVLNNEVFIYAHRKQMYSIAVAHCFVDSAGSFHLDGEFGYKEWGKTISPATKEQRDLLFQKMKEAGYDWDSLTNKTLYNNDYRRLC